MKTAINLKSRHFVEWAQHEARGWALDRVHNSRRWEATHRSDTAPHGCFVATFLHFLTLWALTLTFWPNINWWARYRDGLYLCQVWRFYFQSFWFYRADRQTESQRRINAILTRLPSAWVTRGWALSIDCTIHAGHSIVLLHFVTCDLDLWPNTHW